ncbi:MAG: 1-deoxy-D-xylulose-5-phosphate reductoisomerase, partial [Bacteroidales bacterium]
STLMNKGFEVIEAHWLFGIAPSNIKVLIHPESIIHSMVQFIDGSIKAQLSIPDMRIPILYALTYPYRLPTNFDTPDFVELHSLSFDNPDIKHFPHLQLAYDILNIGGIMPCVLNAANEIAVYAFLNKEIKFTQMYTVIEKTLEKFTPTSVENVEHLISVDQRARKISCEIINQI